MFRCCEACVLARESVSQQLKRFREFAGAPARCFEDTKQAHMNAKLMTTLTTLMAAPWAQYSTGDGRVMYVNRTNGKFQYEKPEAGMIRPVRARGFVCVCVCVLFLLLLLLLLLLCARARVVVFARSQHVLTHSRIFHRRACVLLCQLACTTYHRIRSLRSHPLC